MLPINKIYIDTRQRTADSASHSDFSIELPTTILMLDDTGFYVEDVCLPIAWWTVEEYYNDIVFMEFENAPHMAVITPGSYNTTELGAEIVRAINSGMTTVKFAGEYRKSQGAIVIKWLASYVGTNFTKSFKILTNNELVTKGVSGTNIKRSVNNLLKNFTSSQLVEGFAPDRFGPAAQPYQIQTLPLTTPCPQAWTPKGWNKIYTFFVIFLLF